MTFMPLSQPYRRSGSVLRVRNGNNRQFSHVPPLSGINYGYLSDRNPRIRRPGKDSWTDLARI